MNWLLNISFLIPPRRADTRTAFQAKNNEVKAIFCQKPKPQNMVLLFYEET